MPRSRATRIFGPANAQKPECLGGSHAFADSRKLHKCRLSVELLKSVKCWMGLSFGPLPPLAPFPSVASFDNYFLDSAIGEAPSPVWVTVPAAHRASALFTLLLPWSFQQHSLSAPWGRLAVPPRIRKLEGRRRHRAVR